MPTSSLYLRELLGCPPSGLHQHVHLSSRDQALLECNGDNGRLGQSAGRGDQSLRLAGMKGHSVLEKSSHKGVAVMTECHGLIGLANEPGNSGLFAVPTAERRSQFVDQVFGCGRSRSGSVGKFEVSRTSNIRSIRYQYSDKFNGSKKNLRASVVLFVADLCLPNSGRASREGEVHHRRIGPCPMPMSFSRRSVNHIARRDPRRRAIFGLDHPRPGDHIEELSSRVTVPVASCTWSELDGDDGDAFLGLPQSSVPNHPREVLPA